MPKIVKNQKEQKGKFLGSKKITISSSPKELIEAARVLYIAGLRNQNFEWALLKAAAKIY